MHTLRDFANMHTEKQRISANVRRFAQAIQTLILGRGGIESVAIHGKALERWWVLRGAVNETDVVAMIEGNPAMHINVSLSREHTCLSEMHLNVEDAQEAPFIQDRIINYRSDGKADIFHRSQKTATNTMFTSLAQEHAQYIIDLIRKQEDAYGAE